ncbi:MAG: EAL domain-containing protein [Coxiellaceae bacterium]|nr:EAL domain-containing protein [Coxiellaceae bacterium]
MKILIVDDSKTSLLITATQLEKFGHTTVSISDPCATLETYKNEKPDLIILDVLMEKQSGYDCAKKITEYNFQKDDWVPIIFLSAILNDSAIEDGINAGGDDYLTKPLNTTILKSKIQAMERIARMRQKLLESTQKFEKLSLTDSLTSLPNRHYYEATIKQELANAERANKPLALLFLDLDKFKDINDTLGHHFGDLLLQQTAERIKNELRKGDYVSRLGGDEFSIILPNIKQPEDAAPVAEKINLVISKPFDLDGNEIQISSSIGIACYPEAGRDAETLTKHADIAMYRAKTLGRNTFQFFTSELNTAHSHKIEMERSLSKAISLNQLTLALQPKYQFSPKKIIGFEILLRWCHPKHGQISPDEFIPIAEETGFIIDIGEWVITHACEALDALSNYTNQELTFAINISPIQINKGSILALLEHEMQQHHLSPKQLEIEITETAIMAYSKTTEQALQHLHDFGIRIDIDDFGTGYSSLSHLKRLPIDGLKIDKGFVMDIPSDENDAAIIRAIISLAKGLDLDVIAEGVETEEQLQFLIDNGCNQGQGYYLSKPLSFDQAIELLRQQSSH